jgi:O-antigen/teichoic acid export membrane protein
MGVRKNFVYSSILTTAKYIFPLIIFPYVSRIIGVINIGLIGFVDSIVNYFVLFSSMGINLLGIREIAKNRNKVDNLNKTFSELFFIHLIFTMLALLVYIILILSVSQLHDHQDLFYVGASKLLFSLFTVEWFFRGIENFKYITIRNIAIQILYTILVFLFVRESNDYKVYFFLSCGVVALSAIINWAYAGKFVKLIFHSIVPLRLLKSFYILGLYTLLTSIYTTLNVTYLGFVSSKEEVGYYTTAIKFYYIILGIFSAFTSVMYPKVSSVLENSSNNINSIKNMIYKSYMLTFLFCFPIIFCVIPLASEIISLFVGVGYEGVILPLQLIIILICFVGVSQINAMQILLPMNKEAITLIFAVIGAVCSIILNIVLVGKYQSLGTSFVLVISELVVTVCLGYAAYRYAQITFPFQLFWKHLLCAVPYIFICIAVKSFNLIPIVTLIIVSVIAGIYFILSQLLIIKNPILKEVLDVKFKRLCN